MKSDIVFLGVRSGKSKKGNDYCMCSFGLADKNPDNGYQAINTFISDPDVEAKVKSCVPLEKYSANLILANNTWILVDIYG